MDENLWQDIPFSERPKAHPSTERLEIEKLKERVAELEALLSETAEELFVTASECYELTNHIIGMKDLYHQRRQVFRKARAALKGKDDG